MAKLTKQRSKLHNEAEELLRKDVLTLDEKIFVYENWNEAAKHDSTRAGAFFTPMELANDFKLEVAGPRIIDLCAGIGILSFCKYHFQDHSGNPPEITCVELNPDYVRVGQKLLPEATWICGDVLEIWRDLPRDFTTAISNPPFGRIKCDGKAPRYTGQEFEYKIIDIAGHLAEFGAFILPQMSAPFQYSGVQCYQRRESDKYLKLSEQTGIVLDIGCGIDTSYHKDGWKLVNVAIEIACCDFTSAEVQAPPVEDPPEPTPMQNPVQQSLFDLEAA
jgi:hypothetical protein